ncbi:hypothetical protein SAMN06269250_4558 [Spirosoma fluviale]|uniref:Uncharacterized protein n=1 Tax=Spirosoma fluviale TaxID=1597977 RepID=A0A286GDN0_9BACT|nr:hypothetical protein SAMN06269250_4558 [Spirosoma fluviale]
MIVKDDVFKLLTNKNRKTHVSIYLLSNIITGLLYFYYYISKMR